MNKFLGFLGLAMKAGRIVAGAGLAADSGERLWLLVLAADAGKDAVKKAVRLRETRGVPLLESAYSKAELGAAVGKKPCAVLAVTDKRFADNILKLNIDYDI